MATYQVVYWQEIPVQVDAREAGLAHKQPLSPRFQQLVDTAARQRHLDSAEDYIRAWIHGQRLNRPGPAAEVARAVAAELEAQFERIRDAALGSGPSRLSSAM